MPERPPTATSGDTLALATSVPLPYDQDSFREPRGQFTRSASPSGNSPHQSFANSNSSMAGSNVVLTGVEKSESSSLSLPILNTKSPKPKRRPRNLIGLAVLAFIIVLLAICLAVYFAVIKPKHRLGNFGYGQAAADGTGTTSTTQSTPSGTPQNNAVITGGDGSVITTEDGSTFTYSNKFGGFWVSDPNDPFNNNAQPNSWTPPLNQTWDFNKNRINGVNLGGLFVLEPFISPSLFQKYPDAVDEWTLSTLMAADQASGGLGQLEEHYKTFITENDIAEIAGAGLTWVRVPIPFWAIDTWPGEPFLAKTSWKYIVRLFGWCRKYGIRVNLDLHAIPGSQNGYNHSGKSKQINFLHGVMGWANAQRTLNYIRIITEFISQPQWKDVVPMFGIMNEPMMGTIGRDQLRSFYVEAHSIIRNITGYGAGKGPYMSIHDSFQGPAPWNDFMRGADRVSLDVHPYFSFGGDPANDPIASGTGAGAGGVWPRRACDRWARFFNDSRNAYGITVAGEWSNGWNDCGLFLRGIGVATSYGGNCEDWQDSSRWDEATKAGLLKFASASMDSLGEWFFWTWKIGNSTKGHVESPLWSYQLGLREGWVPKDPRSAAGTCDGLGSPGSIFNGQYPTWMGGGEGAGPPNDATQYPWPPLNIINGGPPARLPSYTATGTIATLAPPMFTAPSGKAIDGGNGWFNVEDRMPAPTSIAGCVYPDPWDSETGTVPPVCTGGTGAAAPDV